MIWAELAHWIALAPLAWLLGLSLLGKDRDVMWWWLAAAFAVSWLADALVDVGASGWIVSAIYPATQASLVGAALIYSRRRAVGFAILVHLAAALSIALHGVEGPEYASRILAWGTIAWLAFRFWQLGPLRTALVIYFGLGLIAWIWHAEWLVVATWWPYQVCRFVGLAWFCGAATRDRLAPRPSVLRSAA